MTLLNVWVSADRALLATDTKCAGPGPGGSAISFHTNKMVALPSMNAVVAGRGHMAVLTYLMFRIRVSTIDTFDALLIEAQRSLCAVATADAETLIRHTHGDAIDTGPQQLAFVGWSAARGAMVAAIIQRRQSGGGWERMDVTEGDWLSAWEDHLQGEAPIPNSHEALARIARAQVAHVRNAFPDAARSTGGRLIVAELTRQRVDMRDVCDLG